MIYTGLFIEPSPMNYLQFSEKNRFSMSYGWQFSMGAALRPPVRDREQWEREDAAAPASGACRSSSCPAGAGAGWHLGTGTWEQCEARWARSPVAASPLPWKFQASLVQKYYLNVSVCFTRSLQKVPVKHLVKHSPGESSAIPTPCSRSTLPKLSHFQYLWLFFVSLLDLTVPAVTQILGDAT